MGKFHDTLAEYGATPGAVFPDGMFDALIAAVAEDDAAAADLSGAKIADLDRINGENNTLIGELKTKLYDMMASAAVDPAAAETFDDPDAPDEDVDEDDADIDDLFGNAPNAEDLDDDEEDDEDN